MSDLVERLEIAAMLPCDPRHRATLKEAAAKLIRLREATERAANELREAANVLRRDFPQFAEIIQASSDQARAALRAASS